MEYASKGTSVGYREGKVRGRQGDAIVYVQHVSEDSVKLWSENLGMERVYKSGKCA